MKLSRPMSWEWVLLPFNCDGSSTAKGCPSTIPGEAFIVDTSRALTRMRVMPSTEDGGDMAHNPDLRAFLDPSPASAHNELVLHWHRSRSKLMLGTGAISILSRRPSTSNRPSPLMQRKTPDRGGDLDIFRNGICRGGIDVIQLNPLGAAGFARKADHVLDIIGGWAHHG